MRDSDREILEANGWIVECESPFEISHEDWESRATGYAADIVLEFYKKTDDEEE